MPPRLEGFGGGREEAADSRLSLPPLPESLPLPLPLSLSLLGLRGRFRGGASALPPGLGRAGGGGAARGFF